MKPATFDDNSPVGPGGRVLPLGSQCEDYLNCRIQLDGVGEDSSLPSWHQP